jgi:hypothetical protein
MANLSYDETIILDEEALFQIETNFESWLQNEYFLLEIETNFCLWSNKNIANYY